jgi:hypothetical protein
MTGKPFTAAKTVEDEWEQQWLRNWKPPEPPPSEHVHALAAKFVYDDFPDLRDDWKRRPWWKVILSLP